MPAVLPQRLRFAGLRLLLLIAVVHCAEAQDVLPETAPLTLDEPLHEVMVRGISQYAERALQEAIRSQSRHWSEPLPPDTVEARRRRLREITGVVDPRVTVTSEPFLIASHTQRPEAIQILSVTWRVMEGVTGEGLLLRPIVPPLATVIAIPDASQTPEEYCGLQDGHVDVGTLPLQLVRAGCLVVVPTLISRDNTLSGHPDIRMTNIPHREFIYRMAFELGRHIIGYELQRILAVADAAESRSGGLAGPIGVCGYGEGGMLALFAAALDPRIEACMVSGYFDDRSRIWQEPIDRNIWQQMPEFSDNELCRLIAPRKLMIETRSAPAWDGPQRNQPGRADAAAPGRISAEVSPSAERAIAAVGSLYEALDAGRSFGTTRNDTAASTAQFLQWLGLESQNPTSAPVSFTTRVDPAARQERQFSELVRFTQALLHRSDKVRAKRWQHADRASVDAWQNSTQSLKQLIHEEMIGRLPEPARDLHPRTRRVITTPTHSGYEVVLDVYAGVEESDPPRNHSSASDIPAAADSSSRIEHRNGTEIAGTSVIAGGILLIPNDLEAGERRPVVVCQHGLEGTPRDTMTEDQSERAWAAYRAFSTQLVRLGYIVYAPQNPYKGYDDFRVIQRKSNPLGRSLFSYIIEQHRQTLRWLRTLPQVDAERIGFYGLSYGGKTAVRVPPLLEREDGTPAYCLSICSADFNEWIRKNSSAEDRFSYVFTPEYEMFEWNMGHTAGYAELASLMAPRPFMVERGHRDGVAPDEWVAWEYAKVRRHYVTLGLADKTQVEWFNGPHTINGVGTFEFLQTHLPLDDTARTSAAN